MAQEYISRKRYEEIKEELDYLVTVKRAEIGAAIQRARAFGDLSENAEYDEARNDQAEMESRIARLEEIINNAVILDDSNIDTTSVGVGCIVVVKDEKTGEEAEFSIVGSTESDPFSGKLSDESPYGKALLGKKAGEVVSIDTPGGVTKVKVVSISK